MTKRLNILIISPNPELGAMLLEHLDPSLFRIERVVSGSEFVQTAQRHHPEIAVLDCVRERPDVVQMEIEVLRNAKPEVRIIALSESSKQDATIVESGVFYYMTIPPGPELIRVVEAAANRFRSPDPPMESNSDCTEQHTETIPNTDDGKE